MLATHLPVSKSRPRSRWTDLSRKILSCAHVCIVAALLLARPAAAIVPLPDLRVDAVHTLVFGPFVVPRMEFVTVYVIVADITLSVIVHVFLIRVRVVGTIVRSVGYTVIIGIQCEVDIECVVVAAAPAEAVHSNIVCPCRHLMRNRFVVGD